MNETHEYSPLVEDEGMEIEDVKPGDTVIMKNGDSAEFGGVVWRPPSNPSQLLAGDTYIFWDGEFHVRKELIVAIHKGKARHD